MNHLKIVEESRESATKDNLSERMQGEEEQSHSRSREKTFEPELPDVLSSDEESFNEEKDKENDPNLAETRKERELCNFSAMLDRMINPIDEMEIQIIPHGIFRIP